MIGSTDFVLQQSQGEHSSSCASRSPFKVIMLPGTQQLIVLSMTSNEEKAGGADELFRKKILFPYE